MATDVFLEASDELVDGMVWVCVAFNDGDSDFPIAYITAGETEALAIQEMDATVAEDQHIGTRINVETYAVALRKAQR